MSNKFYKIGIFSSGGDAPGMNAAIRAVVRSTLYNNLAVSGIMRGYQGMIEGEFIELNSRSVSNIIQRGGTILRTARSNDFTNIEGRKNAYQNLKANKIDALIAIGGDGTFRGAVEFMNEFNIPIIGIPGTIDNDLFGTDFTIGYDTAVNTVIEAVDKIRDTAASHDRLFFVEVMGRDSGCIALAAGIGGGAEYIMLPERDTSIEKLIQILEHGKEHKKSSMIIIVAEGQHGGGAYKVAELVKQHHNFYDTRVTVLGHIQRGGSPTHFDRVLASQLGVAAVESLLNGESGKMVGMINNKIALTDFKEATTNDFVLDKELLRIAEILSY